MADSFQDKTEQATPKRLQKARESGNVPKSAELNSVFILFFGIIVLYFLSGKILTNLILFFKSFYLNVGSVSVQSESIKLIFNSFLKNLLTVTLPLILVIAVVGISSNLLQVGFLFTTKPLTPDLNKINPLAGFKRMFSLKSFVELSKGIFKVAIVGLIAYWTIIHHKQSFVLLANESVAQILNFSSSLVFRLVLNTSMALLVLAILDFMYQKWQYKKDLMMTKQEVKEEQKETEGDPLIKSTIRSLQRARARERMMQNAAEADVVVTNPTELAVALKYDPEVMQAPTVVAKGARLLAQRIKEIARQNDIPIYENKPLARSLFKMCEVGEQIPFELYHAVAEVLAYVYQLRHKNN
ncbi:MAG: flagellar biosynthesis protein FlhB [Calditrichaeota bacterium]|nr:MAG: flagellar biosynthesis protein FlhB [Calditrichota bacterium]